MMMKAKIGAAATNGLLGGIVSGIISGLLNYYLLPFPGTPLDNAIGHGVGGFFCGLVSCIIGILVYTGQHDPQKSSSKSNVAKSEAA
jgi:hypothetical protein